MLRGDSLSLRARSARAWTIVLIALFVSSLLIQAAQVVAAPPPAAAAEGGPTGGDISLDFVAAGPFTYDHATGEGTVATYGYRNRTIDKDTGVVESLEGGDFECGDIVVFFVAAKVDADVPAGSSDLTLQTQFDSQTTSGGDVGFGELVGVDLLKTDTAYTGDEAETISNVSSTGGIPPAPLVVNTTVTDLEAGETIIIRYKVRLVCNEDPNNVTGNIQTAINSASADGDTVQVGQQTVPLKSAGEILLPSVAIFKQPDVGTVDAGSPIGFTVTVYNSGPGPAPDVSFTDPLPGASGILWSESPDSPNCTLNATPPQTLSCSDIDLAAGDGTQGGADTFTVHVTSPTTGGSCGTHNNTATLTGGFTGSASASVTVLCPDVTVSKEPDEGDAGNDISAGDVATFTIVVTNLGPGVATAVTLDDNLPDGVDWTDDSASCTITPDVGTSGQVLECDFGTLAVNATRTVTLTGTTDAPDCGTLINTAIVAASNEPASAGTNNSDAGEIDVLCAVIDVDKTAVPAGPVSAGSEIGFNIVISNTGAGTATGVVVSDNLPAGISWTADAPTGNTTGVSCSINTDAPPPDVLTCTDASMGPGESFTVRIHGITDAADCGTVNNTANVTTGNDGSDSDGASVEVLCGNIDVTKVADAAQVVAGQPIGFVVTVRNVGAGTATGVHVTDTLPTGLSWTIDGAANGFSIVGGQLVFGPANVAGGASASVHIVSPTDTTDCGVINNTATVTTTNDGTDTASATTSVRCPTLTVLKSFSGNTGGTGPGGLPEAAEGDTLTYTVAYDLTNGPVTNGVITDVVPLGLEYVAGSATGNSEFAFVSYTAATRTLRWTAPTVTADGSVTYRVTVAAGANTLVQPLVNTATIDSDETTPSSDTEQVLVEAPPLAATAAPIITLPPTSTLDRSESGTSGPAMDLMLVVLGLAGLALAVAFATPIPARARRGERR